MIGPILALLAAASFALNNVTARRGVISGTVLQGIAITVPLGIPMFLLGAIVFGELGSFANVTWKALLYLALAGCVHFVWGRYFNYRAQYLLGANLAASVQQLDMMLSLALAILILGEVLTPLKIIGIAMLISGPALVVSTRKSSDSKEAKPSEQGAEAAAAPKPAVKKFEPNYVEGYFAVFLSSLGYGVSPILTTLGLRELGAHSSFVGGTIAYLAATIVVVVWVLASGQKDSILQTPPIARRWFTVAGVMVGISQMLRYAALSLAPVTVVQPIQRTGKLFVFYFSWIMNRDKEVFDASLIIATVIAASGAALLSIPTETVLSLGIWPDWFKTVMGWQIKV